MTKVGVIGAAGFAGAELVRLLLRHPGFELAVVTSSSDAGTPLPQLYPAFQGLTDLCFIEHSDPAVYDCDLVFLAVPHTAALALAPELIARGIIVIDLSADFRLADAAQYERWYQTPHTAPGLLESRVFGLPELNRSAFEHAARRVAAGEAVLVACAGCYPTATSLAAAPAVGWSRGLVVADALSGVSGAGRGLTRRAHFVSAQENIAVYNAGSRHRHTPEIEQILDIPGRLVFTPHLVPAIRGLLSTVTLQLGPAGAAVQMDTTQMQAHYAQFYAGSASVSVLPAGGEAKTAAVTGTNHAHISLAVNQERGVLVASCAIDNIGKGAAGQALQCANLLLGLDESTGLEQIALPS